MTPVEKFCLVANEKFNLELDPSTFHRNRPGYWTRKAGTWGWFVLDFKRSKDYGSSDSIGELLKHRNTLELDENGFHVN